jgi:acetyl-CoA carboxylase carboxyl transferase subunit alpha
MPDPISEKKFIMDFERPLEELYQKISELRKLTNDSSINLDDEINNMERRAEELREKIYQNLKPYQEVQMSRHPQRPNSLALIAHIAEDFVELHGDRFFGDDPAIVGGPAYLDGHVRAMFVGHQKGKDTKDNLFRNFGMANPEGYRKALRLFKMAERFHLPIISLVDTPGAYPGIGVEERGQSEAIARNLMEMSLLKVPVVSVIIGEGGSGGALGIAVANRVYMLEHSVYSVISPEGCASILFRDATKAQQAGALLQLTSKDLLKHKIIDDIIPEPLGGAHADVAQVAAAIKETLLNALRQLQALSPADLVSDREQKFRNFGVYIDAASKAKKTSTAKSNQD